MCFAGLSDEPFHFQRYVKREILQLSRVFSPSLTSKMSQYTSLLNFFVSATLHAIRNCASFVGCARELVGALPVKDGFELLSALAEICGDLATLLTVAGTLQLAHGLLRLICVPFRVLTRLGRTNLIKRAPHDVLDEFLSAGQVVVCRAGWVGELLLEGWGIGAL